MAPKNFHDQQDDFGTGLKNKNCMGRRLVGKLLWVPPLVLSPILARDKSPLGAKI